MRGRFEKAAVTYASLLGNSKMPADGRDKVKMPGTYINISMKQPDMFLVQRYYVEHSHEPIITPKELDKVKPEFEQRKQISRKYRRVI